MVHNTAPLSFSGRVAIVTGAGGGLGREYALLLAERGASVVVNDLGGTRSGEGKSSSAADAVVKQIREKGGKAVADYNSVEEGDKIVQTAITNFGRIDILINNAGILRDKSFAKMTVEDWDVIHRVHLRGSFMVTRAAWPHFRKQNYGRIVMTASGAGIYGNFGQANYSAAKLGVLGLANTLSIEGQKYNIHCNTLVPIAASRLTQDILPPDVFDQLRPSLVSPVVAWLCHEQCGDTGAVIETAGGWVGKYQWQRSCGKAFLPQSQLTIEAVRDSWSSLTDMTGASSPASLQEQTMLLIESLSGQQQQKAPSNQQGKSKAQDPEVFSYNEDQAILYALAVGMSLEEEGSLSFLYEGSEDFRVLPTFGTVAAMGALFGSPALREQMEKLNADPTKLLHGEQYLELLKPFPSCAVLTSKCRLLDVLDKGSGAVVIVEEETFDAATGDLLMRSEWSVFLVGAGGFGGPRATLKAHKTVEAPRRRADATHTQKTHTDQAALYRLCGDKNPMHIDPSFAAIGGFDAPILHGLCSLGYATRHVLKHFSPDVTRFKALMARFASPILPGHTLKTDMWKEGDRVHFESMCVETGKKIITGAYVDLHPSAGGTAVPQLGANSLRSEAIFGAMADQLSSMPDLAKKIQAVYEWNINQGGKNAATWTVDLKSGAGRIVRGRIDGIQPGCTLTIEDEDMEALVLGKLDPQKAFMSGKLKIKGNIMLTQKLKPLLSARTQTKKSVAPPLKCEAIFVKLGEKLAKNPDLASSIRTVYQWNILKDGKQTDTWTMDLKNGAGAVYRGAPKADKPDCTFILEDELFTRIMDGSADPQKAFMSGKLKITGNVLASQKLQAIYDTPQEDDEKMSFAPYKQPLLKSDFVFEVFAERLGEEPELAKKMKVIYHWNIMQSGKNMQQWTVDLKSGSGSIYRGAPREKADVVLTMEDEDVILMMLGQLNPQRAFMTGRLKIKGNIMLTQKLNQLWQEILKSGRAVELPILSAVLADKPFDPSLRSEGCFVEFGKRLSRLQPEQVRQMEGTFHFHVTKNAQPKTQWTLELSDDKCMLRRLGESQVKPQAKIRVEDDVFADWVEKTISSKQFLSDVHIEGDAKLVEKLLDSLKITAKL